MTHSINLEAFERQVVDRVIEVYNLPLELILGPDESTSIDDDYFYNCDQNQNIYLEDGLDYILEAINSDNRELFCKELDEGEQVALLRVMAELGVTTETSWKGKDLRLNMPKWQKRIVLPLEGVGKNGETYKLVAERCNTMPGHDEIDVVIEDQNGAVIQDIVRVEPAIKCCNENSTTHQPKNACVKVYGDEYNEDYTNIFDIKVYDDGEETTNY